MLIVLNSRKRASEDESCYQCGKTIREGTGCFEIDQFGHSGRIICSQKCLKDYSAPIQDSIPTFEKSLLGKAFGLAKKKATGNSSSVDKNDTGNSSPSTKDNPNYQNLDSDRAQTGSESLAGKAANTVGSYAWKKVTGEKTEEDIAREKHNMEMLQAKAKIKQEEIDKKEARKEAKRNRREKRAKELESEGKTFSAFWVRNQRWLLPLIIITAIIILGNFLGENESKTQENNKETTINE